MKAYEEVQEPAPEWVASSDELLGTIFDLSFQPAVREHPSVSSLVNLWSYSSPKRVRRATLAVVSAVLNESLEKQIAEFARQDDVFESIRRSYVLPTDSSVTDFLRTHRGVAPVLLEATPQLKVCFGANAIVRLRAPIDESGIRTLYAVVVWPGKLSDVRNALARFDDQWWIANSYKTAGHLVFTYELV